MPEFRVKYVVTYVKKGRRYHYHRKTRERLPDDPLALAARVSEIERALAKPSDEGTVRGLIRRYEASGEFNGLRELTKRDYRRQLERIEQTIGAAKVADLRKKHVRAIRREYQDTPRAANYLTSVLSLLLSFGIEEDEDLYGRTNPAIGIKKLKQGPGYAPWPDSVIKDFAAAAYNELRWVVIGGVLNTGQRGQDVVKMAWSHFDGETIDVRQQKTGELVPITPTAELRQILSEVPRVSPVIFTRDGKPWVQRTLQAHVRDTLKDIGEPGYSLHGLRIKAARQLREAGNDDRHIAAVLGHRTERMTRQYAERKERGRAAVERLDRKRSRTDRESVETQD